MKNLLIIISAILLAACTPKTNDTLTIGVLKGPSAISVAQWLSQSAVIDGKKLTVTVCDEVGDLQALMIQGKVDFAVLPTTVAAILYNKGVDYRMVACPVQGSIYVVSSDSISSFNELKSRKISVSGQGTTPDVLFVLLAQKNGFTKQECQLDFSIGNHADLAQAMVLGKVKTALLPEPFVTMACLKNPSLKPVVSFADELIKADSSALFAMTAFVVRGSMVDAHKALVDSVSVRYRSAIAWLSAHPQEVAEAAVKAKILPNAKVASMCIPRCNIHYLAVADEELQIGHYLNIFFNFDPKTIGSKMPDKRFYYR